MRGINVRDQDLIARWHETVTVPLRGQHPGRRVTDEGLVRETMELFLAERRLLRQLGVRLRRASAAE